VPVLLNTPHAIFKLLPESIAVDVMSVHFRLCGVDAEMCTCATMSPPLASALITESMVTLLVEVERVLSRIMYT